MWGPLMDLTDQEGADALTGSAGGKAGRGVSLGNGALKESIAVGTPSTQSPKFTLDVPDVTGYANVKAAARDFVVFSSDLQGEPDVRSYRQFPLEADPPAHGTYRAILNPFFSRARVVGLEPAIRACASELVGGIVERGGAEVVHELALPTVVRSLGVAFGRPQDVDEWLTWGVGVWIEQGDGTRDGSHLDAYLTRVFDEVLRRPGDDLFSAVAKATIGDRRLTQLEMMGLGNLVLAGGRDTVVNLISCIVWYLAENCAEQQRFAAQPGLWPIAIDEFLRYLSPLPRMERVVTRNTDDSLGGWATGTHVALNFMSANHDVEAFRDPGQLRLDRTPNPHLAFGNGVHACIGAHLARLETRVLLEELLARGRPFGTGHSVEIVYARAGGADIPSEFRALDVVFES
jgi:cytochrome P450